MESRLGEADSSESNCKKMAVELRISHATTYRWAGSPEELVAEVLALLVDDTFRPLGFGARDGLNGPSSRSCSRLVVRTWADLLKFIALVKLLARPLKGGRRCD